MIGRYNAFCEAANLDKRTTPWRMTRRAGKIYGQFVISGSGGDWYDKFIGLDFMAEIVFKKNSEGKRAIAQVIPVSFEGRRAIRGRPIPGTVVSMI